MTMTSTTLWNTPHDRDQRLAAIVQNFDALARAAGKAELTRVAELLRAANNAPDVLGRLCDEVEALADAAVGALRDVLDVLQPAALAAEERRLRDALAQIEDTRQRVEAERRDDHRGRGAERAEQRAVRDEARRAREARVRDVERALTALRSER